ncbi:hypothetical protein [Myxosarcina sp. GI1]|uniref:hypothetical protein n=1 Tax=Myxosarcina sp. GI1 TaxID=1541065 RepID=UPI00055B2A54|nr:hypothetical protein [Myxosarcina sp. GI1]
MKETNIRQTIAARVQSLPAEQIKQAVLKWLDTEEGELVDLARDLSTAPEAESRSELSAAKKVVAFREWADSHRRGLPLLSDEAISRESIYSDERL